jgi:hypothetical protein
MGEKGGAYSVLLGKPGGKSHLEEVGVDGSIILKWITKQWNRWHGMAHDMDRWRAFVCAVMNLRILQNSGDFLTN